MERDLKAMLYEAAIKGDKDQLLNLVQQNANTLDLVTAAFGLKEESLLHIAVQFGHVDFSAELINRRLEFFCDLNVQGQAPLHLASKKGHLDLVKLLLEKDSNVCFVQDRNGRTPLQLAAMHGRLEIVEEIVRVKATAAWMLTSDDEPILHLCAKHNQFEAMMKLVELANNPEFVKLKDNEDNTILHLVAAKSDVKKVIVFLIANGVDVNATNQYGWTALDVFYDNVPYKIFRWHTLSILQRAGAQRKTSKPLKLMENHSNIFNQGLLMLAGLMVTVTFQAVLNPPGGVWQDTGYHNQTILSPDGTLSSTPELVLHYAGQPVMSYIDEKTYKDFFIFNTGTLVNSIFLLSILLSGLASIDKRIAALSALLTLASFIGLLSTYGSATVLLSRNAGRGKDSWLFITCDSFQRVFTLMPYEFCLYVCLPGFSHYLVEYMALYLKFSRRVGRFAEQIRASRAEPIP